MPNYTVTVTTEMTVRAEDPVEAGNLVTNSLKGGEILVEVIVKTARITGVNVYEVSE